MFTKIPLQGLSCASCDKNVVNIQGMPADYYNWKKMPQSKDRVPMVNYFILIFRWDKDFQECFSQSVMIIYLLLKYKIT
jgi:hypothetical protein